MRRALIGVLCACGRVGFDPVGTGTTGDGGNGNGSGSDAGSGAATCQMAPLCPEKMLMTDNASSTGTGNTTALDRGWSGSCGGATGAESTFELTALNSGKFQISVSTAGPYVLYLRDGCCGAELGCSAAPLTSPIVIELVGQQKIVAVVDNATVGTNVALQVSGLGP